MFSLSAKQVLESRPMPAVPVVVLTRGRRVWPHDAYGNEMERIWMELQDELSELGTNPVHLIAERSGHMIHLDQPGIVISAMQTMLDANFSRIDKDFRDKLWRSLGESNPCFRRERPASWATRRRELSFPILY